MELVNKAVWKLNRLARNPVDGGTISWMLQQGIILHIQTVGRGYYPEDNVIVMSVELGMANQYVRDLSTDTKRGIRERIEKGYPNGVAPIGYLNDLAAEAGNRGWLVDEEKFPLIVQLLEMFHSRKYSIMALLKIANEEMGLRTPIHKKQGGKKLVMSHIMETVLKNPVYAGFFFTKDGERHELNESIPRAMSEEKYWEIQKILEDKGRPRPSKYKLSFAYTGTTKCGGCGGVVTAEHKYQIICDCKRKFPVAQRTHCPTCGIAIKKMKKPKHLRYIYYHCTRTKDRSCREGSMRETYMDDALSSYFKENFKISKDLHEWCIKNMETLDKNAVKDGSERKVSLEATLTKKRKEYQELVLMKARGMIADDDFLEIKGTQKGEIETLERSLKTAGVMDKTTIKRARRAFDLALGIGFVD